MVAGLKRGRKRFSYADYLNWDDDKRYEIIDGIVYDMNAPLRQHQKYVSELLRQIGNFFYGKTCEVYVAPFDVRLPKKSKRNEDIFDVVQPDILVVCDPEKLDDKGCVGAPDLVVEVISPSTASKDQLQKRALYERSGVREFWLLHPEDRLVFIYVLGKNGFGKPEVFESSSVARSFIFPELSIDLQTIFPHIEKKSGSPPPPEERAQ
ncbi:MAG: Uma2 family endonuclease [Candidatus Rifleibacteriota bacterium]